MRSCHHCRALSFSVFCSPECQRQHMLGPLTPRERVALPLMAEQLEQQHRQLHTFATPRVEHLPSFS